MIGILRNRKFKLSNKQSFGQTLGNAVREIILVVIGILLALSINNWNASIKNRNLEKIYIQEILLNLESDSIQLQSIIEKHTISYDLILTSISNITSQNYDKEELASHYATIVRNNHTFFPLDGGYLSLISNGHMNLLNNKNLSSIITNLYEHYYQRLVYNGEIIDNRIDNVIFDSQNYFLYESGKFIESQFIESKMLAHLDYLARGKRTYLERSKSARDALYSTLSILRSNLEE